MQHLNTIPFVAVLCVLAAGPAPASAQHQVSARMPACIPQCWLSRAWKSEIRNPNSARATTPTAPRPPAATSALSSDFGFRVSDFLPSENPPPPTPHTIGEDARLYDSFQQYLEAHFREQPIEATRLGDHRFDNLLDDLSRPAQEAWVAHARQTLDALPLQVDDARLSRAGQIDLRFFRQDAARAPIWLARKRAPFRRKDPRVYDNCITDSVYLLLTRSTLPPETNIANCLARMALNPARIIIFIYWQQSIAVSANELTHK